MRKLKYIRTHQSFVIFSEPLMHSEIKPMSDLISAGFCHFDHYEQVWKCYGESISLNLKSKSEDSELLTKQMNGEY